LTLSGRARFPLTNAAVVAARVAALNLDIMSSAPTLLQQRSDKLQHKQKQQYSEEKRRPKKIGNNDAPKTQR
jgi:hypothetical protein